MQTERSCSGVKPALGHEARTVMSRSHHDDTGMDYPALTLAPGMVGRNVKRRVAVLPTAVGEN